MADVKFEISVSVEKMLEAFWQEGYMVQKWIPCSDRMPEKHEEVLAYSPYWGKIVVAMWGGEFWLEQWTDDDLEQSEITHWMPLPEPPEGGANDAT